MGFFEKHGISDPMEFVKDEIKFNEFYESLTNEDIKELLKEYSDNYIENIRLKKEQLNKRKR